MRVDEFREIALALPEAEESSHMDHPDFRVGGKIFASLGPDLTWSMVKLTPTEQQDFLRVDRSFAPAAGKWGERGATIITLQNAEEDNIRLALNLAWRNTAPKRLLS